MRRRWWFVVVAAAAVGCRSHRPVCEDSFCVNAGGRAEPSGGAPTQPDDDVDDVVAGASGNGGADGGSGASCQDHLECDNGVRCDGVERCTANGCEPGELPECSSGTSCDEEAPELCVYPEASPWLVVTAVDKLLGLPTAELGRRPLIELGSRPRIDAWTGFDDVFWAPDGRFLAVQTAEIQLGLGVSYLRFGAGLPTPLARLPELPSWVAGANGAIAFSPDSRYFFASDRDSAGFLFDLDAPALEPRALSQLTLDFCASPGSWVTGGEVQTLRDGEVGTRALPPGNAALSPDRRLIAVERVGEDDESLGIVLTACGDDAWQVELSGDDAMFSPSSQLLWVEDYATGVVVWSLVEPSSPELVLRVSDELYYRREISPHGRYLLAEDDAAYYALDLTAGPEPSPIRLGIPRESDIVQLRDDGVLAWSAWSGDGPRELLWLPLPSAPSPIVLHEEADSSAELLFDARVPSAFFIGTDDGQTSTLLRVELDAAEPAARLLLTVDGNVSQWVLASDGSGVAFGVQSGTVEQAPFFAAFQADGTLGEPIRIAQTGYRLRFQPWP